MRKLDGVCVEAGDFQGRIAGDVSVTVVFSAGVDLLVAELSQVRGRKSLWCTIAVSMEDLFHVNIASRHKDVESCIDLHRHHIQSLVPKKKATPPKQDSEWYS